MRKGKVTRERIVEAARDLFWRDGYHAVSVESICTAANARKGSLYHAFGSKEDLLCAVIDAVWAHNKAQLTEIYAADISDEEKLRRHFQWFSSSQQELKDRFGFIPGTLNMALGTNVPTKALELMERNRLEHQDMLRDAIMRVGQEDNTSREGMEKLAWICVSIMNGVLINARLSNQLDGFAGLPDALFTLLKLGPALASVYQSDTFPSLGYSQGSKAA